MSHEDPVVAPMDIEKFWTLSDADKRTQLRESLSQFLENGEKKYKQAEDLHNNLATKEMMWLKSNNESLYIAAGVLSSVRIECGFFLKNFDYAFIWSSEKIMMLNEFDLDDIFVSLQQNIKMLNEFQLKEKEAIWQNVRTLEHGRSRLSTDDIVEGISRDLVESAHSCGVSVKFAFVGLSSRIHEAQKKLQNSASASNKLQSPKYAEITGSLSKILEEIKSKMDTFEEVMAQIETYRLKIGAEKLFHSRKNAGQCSQSWPHIFGLVLGDFCDIERAIEACVKQVTAFPMLA